MAADLTTLAKAAEEVEHARRKWERLRHEYAEEVAKDPGFKYFTFSCNFKNGGRMGGREYEYVGIRIDEAVYLSGNHGDFRRWRDFVKWCRDNLQQMSPIYELVVVENQDAPDGEGTRSAHGVLLPEKP